jgi:hypothetical protein
MGLGDVQQILLTDGAYTNMIDMTEDTTLENKFRSHGTIAVKHDIPIGIYQYVGAGENFLNTGVPTLVSVQAQFDTVKRNPVFKGVTMPSNPNELLQQAAKMVEILGIISATEGENSPMSSFIELMTSERPEDLQKFREFVETNQKLTELRKLVFKTQG